MGSFCQRTVGLLAAGLLAACGPPGLAGTYSGTLTTEGTCSDGSTVDQSVSAVGSVSQAGSSVSVALPGVNCKLSGTASGETMSFGKATCPPVSNTGWTSQSTLQDGSATLRGRGLTVLVHATTDSSYAGGPPVSCATTTFGTLDRR